MLRLSLYKEFKDTNKRGLNIHVMRVVFLKLVGKLACNARLPAYIFCCKGLTKKELQTLLIRRFELRQTHCCIDLKLTLKLRLVTLCSSILEQIYFLKIFVEKVVN